MLPGNDLAWTHLREEPSRRLVWRALAEWWMGWLSAWGEGAVSSLPPKGLGKRELTHMDSFPTFWHSTLLYLSCWSHLIFTRVSVMHEMLVINLHPCTFHPCSFQGTRESQRTKVTLVLDLWASHEYLACAWLCVRFSGTAPTTKIHNIALFESHWGLRQWHRKQLENSVWL